LRVVAAGLGGSVIPRQVAARSEKLRDICVIALTDACAKRRFPSASASPRR
jgi:hypothetical protein